jgi:hypothetical protein
MKPLRFIHISKTGGQAIETVAKEQAGIRWGSFDEEYGLNMLCHRLLSNVDNPSIIDKHDWFMVVRNPYERMVSQYNWYIERIKENIDVNLYLCRELTDLESRYTRFKSHFTEQYRYLQPQYNIRVLRYENIEEEFNALMKEYGYNILLDRTHNVSTKVASLYDLSLETIELINKVYEKDFTTFGYEMVHSVFQMPSPENSASVAS